MTENALTDGITLRSLGGARLATKDYLATWLSPHLTHALSINMFPQEFHIRDIQISPNVVLAPMEGVTDLSFRRLIRHIGGVGLTCTEFIASSGLKKGHGKMWEMARFDSDERPISIQIYGNPGPFYWQGRSFSCINGWHWLIVQAVSPSFY